MRNDPTIEITEAIWSLDGTDAEWMAQIVDVASNVISDAAGIVGYRFDLLGDTPRADCVVGTDPAIAASPRLAHALFDSSCAAQSVYGASPGPLLLAPTNLGGLGLAPVLDIYAAAGVTAMLGLLGHDTPATGWTLGVGFPRADGRRHSGAARQRWQRVCQALSLASRVRRGLHAETSSVVGEVDCRGRGELLPEAEGAFAELLEAARSGQIWRDVCGGRWAVVRRHDGAGRTRYLLVESTPFRDLDLLSPLESEICLRAANGEASKVIAAELHLSESAVAQRLQRAARKLGLSSRHHLVELVASLQRFAKRDGRS